MLVYVVDKSNRARFADEIDLMHQQRHAVFVETLGWEALRRPDGRDIDQFDTDETVYLLCISSATGLIAHVRHNPTTGPHQLADDSPLRHYALEHVPRGPNVWEATRNIGGMIKDLLPETMKMMRLGSQEWALDNGVDTAIGIAVANVYQRMLGLGWGVTPLGPPQAYEDAKRPDTALGMQWNYSQEILDASRKEAGISYRVTYKAPAGETPIPFLIFDTYQILDRVQKGSFLKRLEPLLGPCPDVADDDAAYDYLLRLETPEIERDALRIADLVISEVSHDTSNSGAL